MFNAARYRRLILELECRHSQKSAFLYHGTVAVFLDSIQVQGLLKRSRNHVHLSADADTAALVGLRRGKPVILTIHAQRMHLIGHSFYLSQNGVWLTETVPATFIDFPLQPS